MSPYIGNIMTVAGMTEDAYKQFLAILKELENNPSIEEAIAGKTEDAIQLLRQFQRIARSYEDTGQAFRFSGDAKDSFSDIVLSYELYGSRASQLHIGLLSKEIDDSNRIGELLGWETYDCVEDQVSVFQETSRQLTAATGIAADIVQGIDRNVISHLTKRQDIAVVDKSVVLHELAHTYLYERKHEKSIADTPVFTVILNAVEAIGDPTQVLSLAKARLQNCPDTYSEEDANTEIFCDAMAHHLSPFELPECPILGRFFNTVVLLDSQLALNSKHRERELLWTYLENPNAFFNASIKDNPLSQTFHKETSTPITPDQVLTGLEKWKTMTCAWMLNDLPIYNKPFEKS